MSKETEHLILHKLAFWLLRSPFSWFVIPGGMVYVFSKLPKQQFDQVIRLFAALNHPVGWGICAGLAVTAIYQVLVKPLASYAKTFLDAYLDEKAKYVKVLTEIKDNLSGLEQLFEKDFIEIMREIRRGLKSNHTEILKVSADLSSIIMKRAVFKHKTDRFHAPSTEHT